MYTGCKKSPIIYFAIDTFCSTVHSCLPYAHFTFIGKSSLLILHALHPFSACSSSVFSLAACYIIPSKYTFSLCSAVMVSWWCVLWRFYHFSKRMTFSFCAHFITLFKILPLAFIKWFLISPGVILLTLISLILKFRMINLNQLKPDGNNVKVM